MLTRTNASILSMMILVVSWFLVCWSFYNVITTFDLRTLRPKRFRSLVARGF